MDLRLFGSLAIVFRNLVNRFTMGLIINIKQAQANSLACPLTQVLQREVETPNGHLTEPRCTRYSSLSLSPPIEMSAREMRAEQVFDWRPA